MPGAAQTPAGSAVASMVYTAAIDRQLNDHSYIAPGRGDAGDRFSASSGAAVAAQELAVDCTCQFVAGDLRGW